MTRKIAFRSAHRNRPSRRSLALGRASAIPSSSRPAAGPRVTIGPTQGAIDAPQASVQFLHLADLPRFLAMLHSMLQASSAPTGRGKPQYRGHPGGLSAGFASLGEQEGAGGGGRRRPGTGFASPTLSLDERPFRYPRGKSRWGCPPGGSWVGVAALGEQEGAGGGGRRRPGAGFASLGEQKVPGGG